MSTFAAVIWILGVALGIVVLCAIIVDTEKKQEKNKYDERQIASRNAGYRVAFYVGFAYYGYLCIGFSSAIELNDLQAEPYLLMFFGILIQLLTVHIYALLTDSALPLGENPMAAIASYAGMGLLPLLRLPRLAEKYPGMPLRGHGSLKWAYLSLSIFFLLLALSHLISMLRRRKEEE